MRRVRRHLEDDPSREQVRVVEEEPEEQADERGLAGETLRLQSLLGNRNVGALIARAPLQRDRETTTTPAGEELHPADSKGGVEAADGYKMTIEGLGSFELLSFSIVSKDPGSTDRDYDKSKPRPTEFAGSKRADKLSPKLMEAAVKGTKFDSVQITLTKGGKTLLTIKLKGVYLSNYQTGGTSGGAEPMETFGINAGEAEFEFAPEEK